MTHRTTDTLHVVAAYLNAMPLPEPSSAGVVDGVPHVTWITTRDAARDILEAVGRWLPAGGPDAVACYVDHLGTPIRVEVQAPGVVALAGEVA